MKVLLVIVLFIGIRSVIAAQTPSAEDSAIPTCKKSEGKKLIGGGRYGLNFSIPKRGFDVRGGKPDVDYVLYKVSPKKSRTVLQLWFGGMTLPLSPASQKLESSTNLHKTKLKLEDKNVEGMDFRGRSMDGRYWRHFAIEYQGGAVYDTKDRQEADQFG